MADQIRGAATYVRSNVLPAIRVRPSVADPRQAVSMLYAPAAVVPLQACGGFNCVVELSSSTCRIHAQAALRPTTLDRTIEHDTFNTIVGAATAAPSIHAGGLAAEMSEPDGARLSLVLSGLTFPAPDTVALRFRVSVVLLPGELKLASVLQQAAAGQSAAASSISGGEILAGEFEAELRAPIFHHDDPSRCRARVFADLRRGVWADSPPPASPPGALRLVYDACFSDWLTHATSLLQAPLDLPLSPTLSLVGQNLGSVAVQEIRDFEVQTFAVPSPSGFESALVIAFDVMPGCHGIVEDVQHFIGPSGFGVISDEFVVASVFQHQWHLGGFDRQCSFQSRTQAKVTRSGHEQLEDAIVFGYQDLLTLDNVAITTESNTRTDRLQFGGQGLLVPTTVRLVADGQSVTAAEAGLVPQPADWHGSAQLLPTLPPDPDPRVRDFQIKASKDGARHITQPFAYITDSDPRLAVTYVRIEGVTKQMLVLGDLNAPME